MVKEVINLKNKRGQIAIFVIIAVVLVGSIIFLFFFLRGGAKLSIGEDFDPNSYISSCIRDAARSRVENSLSHGGFSSPENVVIYDNKNIVYLCQNVNYYESCINQYPNLVSSVNNDLKSFLQMDAEKCFSNLEIELDDRGYTFSGGNVDTKISLKPGIVELKVSRDFSFSKGGTSKNFQSFSTQISSPFYDLILIANEIVKQEAQYCYFSNDGFNILYHDFEVKKDLLSGGTKIYTVKDKKTNEALSFGIRGCIIPQGF